MLIAFYPQNTSIVLGSLPLALGNFFAADLLLLTFQYIKPTMLLFFPLKYLKRMPQFATFLLTHL